MRAMQLRAPKGAFELVERPLPEPGPRQVRIKVEARRARSPRVQFAVKMGFRTVAIARGADKAKLALELGAHQNIDSTAEDAAKALTALGGAKVILATVASGKAMTPLIDGLGTDGKLLVVGASPEPIEVTPKQLIGQRRSVSGWPSGRAADSEDTCASACLPASAQ